MAISLIFGISKVSCRLVKTVQRLRDREQWLSLVAVLGNRISGSVGGGRGEKGVQGNMSPNVDCLK